MGRKASAGDALRPLLIGTGVVVFVALMVWGRFTGIVGYWVDTISLASMLLLLVLIVIVMFRSKLHLGGSNTSDLITVNASGFGFWILFVLVAVLIVFLGWQTILRLEDIPYLSDPAVAHIEDVQFDYYDGEFSSFYHLQERPGSDGAYASYDVPESVYDQGLDLAEQASASQGTRLDATIEYLPHSEQVIDVDYEFVEE
jgi:ABC-type transport system involved in multi-copper enzyme maturation permease subunit